MAAVSCVTKRGPLSPRVQVRRTPQSPDWQRSARVTENTLPTLSSALVRRLADSGQSAIARERTLRPMWTTVCSGSRAAAAT